MEPIEKELTNADFHRLKRETKLPVRRRIDGSTYINCIKYGRHVRLDSSLGKHYWMFSMVPVEGVTQETIACGYDSDFDKAYADLVRAFEIDCYEKR